MCRPRTRMTYFERSATADVPAKIHQPFMLHQSPCSVPGTRRTKATPFPVRKRARRPHEHALRAERDRDLEDPGDGERDEDLRDRQLEVERDLAEHLQGDDHRRQMEARIAQRGQQDRVVRAPDPQRRAAG